MKDLLTVALFVLGWIFLTQYLLPKLGVST
jgi:hypothetical protein